MRAAEQVYGRVARVLVEALNVDEHELSPNASLQRDLGAESIDFLDIVFRLEREFAIKIPRGELFPESIFAGDPELVRDGKITDQGMRELRSRMPYADLHGFDHERNVSAVPELFTVDLLVRYIAWKEDQGVKIDSNHLQAVSSSPAPGPAHQQRS